MVADLRADHRSKRVIFDGIFTELQHIDKIDWKEIGFDMRSPFENTRPPLVAGKPEERNYQMRYFIDNTTVGAWSNVVTVITIS